MIVKISSNCFSLDYKIPLNKRFSRELKKIIEDRGYVVTDTLPHDDVTMFGKSQPHITIYKSQGAYVRENKVVGASVYKEPWCVLTGATVELKRSVVHLRSRSAAILQASANMIRVAGSNGKSFKKREYCGWDNYIWLVSKS